MTQAVNSWVDAEPGIREMRLEASCILRRAIARAKWVVTLALLAGLGAALLRYYLPSHFRSRAVLRVHDTRLAAGAPPVSSGELQAELDAAVFTRASLLKIMREFNLYHGPKADETTTGLSEMRRKLEVGVIQDSVVGRDGLLVSTTNLTIAFVAEDPESALRVVQRVTELVTQAATKMRHSEIAAALSVLHENEANIELRLAEFEEDRQALRGDTSVQAQLEARRLNGSVAELEKQLDSIREQTTSLWLEWQSDEQDLAIRFEVLEPGHLPPPKRLTRQQEMALAAGLTFLLMLPTFGVFLGISDTRLQDEDGLRRTGVNLLAQVPAFAGHQFGALQARRARTRSN
jgi:hypothetical protein